MNVTIKADFGEMTFEMSRESALELMQRAMDLQKGDRPKGEETERSIIPVAKPVPVPRSTRTETMFGARETWDTPAKETESHPEGYKGFLHIKCEECGEVRTFCAKYPETHHRCVCGHITELKDLIPVHVRCECGGDYTYKTNRDDTQFTINCLGCKTPVDMELNKRGTAYVPVGRKTALWGGTKDDPYVLHQRTARRF